MNTKNKAIVCILISAFGFSIMKEKTKKRINREKAKHARAAARSRKRK